MLTRVTRPPPAVRAFILAPPLCSASTPSRSATLQHPHTRAVAKSRHFSTKPSKKTKSVPYALAAAAQAFEEHVQLEELEFIQQTYEHLRQVVLEARRRELTLSDDLAAPRVLREPEGVMKNARALLASSSRREHALLHLTIARDLVSVFRSPVEPVHPLSFTVQTFDRHLKDKTLSALPHVYDHLCHLVDAAPDEANILAIEPIMWRPIAWMRELSEDSQKTLGDLIPRILNDLPRLFRTQPTSKHHTLVIKGFLAREMPDDAWNWLRQMELQASRPQPTQSRETSTLWDKMRRMSGFEDPDSTSSSSDMLNVWCKPLSDDYDLLLKYFSRHGDSVAARMLLAHMPAPSQRSWHYLLAAILAKPVPNLKARVQAVVEEMESAGFTVHLGTLGALAGKGPVASWVGDEVLHVLGAAHQRGGYKRDPVRDQDGVQRTAKSEVTPKLHAQIDRRTPQIASTTPHENLGRDSKPSTANANISQESFKAPATLTVAPQETKDLQGPPPHKSSHSSSRSSQRHIAPVESHESPSAQEIAAPSTRAWSSPKISDTPQTAMETQRTPQIPVAVAPLRVSPDESNTTPTSSLEEPFPVVSTPPDSCEVVVGEVPPQEGQKSIQNDDLPKSTLVERVDAGEFGIASPVALDSTSSSLLTNTGPSSTEDLPREMACADSQRQFKRELPAPPMTQLDSHQEAQAHEAVRKSAELLIDVPDTAFTAPAITVPTSEWLESTALQRLTSISETIVIDESLARSDPRSVERKESSIGSSSLDQNPSVGLENVGGMSPLDPTKSGQLDPTMLPDGQNGQEEILSVPYRTHNQASGIELEDVDSGPSLDPTVEGVSPNAEHCAETRSLAASVVNDKARPQPGEPPVHTQNSTDQTAASGTNRFGRDTRRDTYHQIRGLIYSAIKRGDLRDASKHYADLIKVALPDIFVATSLLSALCGNASHAPPRPHIMQALRIYRDLVKAEEYDAVKAKGWPKEKRLDIWIYNVLLRALTAHPPPDASARDYGPEERAEYTKFAMELLADMEARGLRPNDRTVASIFLLWFRGAKNHQEAFGYYRDLLEKLETAASSSQAVSHRLPHTTAYTPPVLDVFGYKAVLHAFGNLSFPRTPIAPAHLWCSMVDDMRARGHSVTLNDYTLFLGAVPRQKTTPRALQQASLGIPPPEGEEDRMRAMYASVKYVHQKLTLDPNISPDAHLLNTLINAYQLLGAFDDALRVFNTAWLSGRVDHVTPIIMFDTCGHAGRQDVASMIWCMLVAKGWKFDKRTLDTWVECLCRGNVEAACRFVCVYMGRKKAGYLSKGDTRPDKHTCHILLKLAWLTGQNPEVKERIKTHLPRLYVGLSPHYQ